MQRQRRPTGVEPLDAPAEHAAKFLQALLCLSAAGEGQNLLEKPRHSGNGRWLDVANVLEKRILRFGQAERAADGQARVMIDEPAVYVAQGQPTQDDAVLGDTAAVT